MLQLVKTSLMTSLEVKTNNITDTKVSVFFVLSYNNLGDYMKIIDVSDKYIFALNHIDGSINIPYDELINNYRHYLNKNDSYYLYCQSGKLSKRAYMVLSSLGYNVFILKK